MKVLDLLELPNKSFSSPPIEALERFLLPFIIADVELEKDDLQLLLQCDDFESISVASVYRYANTESLIICYKL